ncbi:MAG: YlbF family regulator [Clostridiales bacterium]|nr:YlbF family regulator [Clostridiales bacterium]
MEILLKAKELGMLIAESEELSKLQRSEVVANQDEKAKKLLDEYNSVQAEFVKSLRQGDEKETLEKLRDKLKEKQKQLNDYDITKNFLDGKKAFENLMKNVNDIITHEITGETSCSHGGCSTCGKCK